MPQYESGAKREVHGVDYSLIPPSALRRLAQIYTEGAQVYGVTNWRKGLPEDGTFNHLMEHLQKWLEGDRSEDHLAKAAWGTFALMFYEDTEHGTQRFPPIFDKYLEEDARREDDKKFAMDSSKPKLQSPVMNTPDEFKLGRKYIEDEVRKFNT